MHNIIGQTKLMSIIDSYTTSTLPKALMLVGPDGCGKHLVAQYVAKKFNLDFVEIDDSATAGDLDSFLFSTINTLYLIDLNKFSKKQQNIFLKVIEEPSKSAYFILTTASEVNVLDTILNRCIKHTFEAYTKDQIEAITNTSVNDLAFKIFKTPGKLLNLTEGSFKDVFNLAATVARKLSYEKYENALALSTKINYKDLYNKVDFNLFFDAVEYIAFEDFKANNTKDSLTVFMLTNKFKQHATQPNILKEMLIINYITELWEALHQ